MCAGQAVLQDALKVEVGGEIYTVAPPTLATTIRVSELASQLPMQDAEDKLSFVIEKAKHTRILGSIVATLILGELKRNLKEKAEYKHTFRKIEKDALYLSEQEIVSLIGSILIKNGSVEGFYQLITFLKGINLLKRTKMIPSGH